MRKRIDGGFHPGAEFDSNREGAGQLRNLWSFLVFGPVVLGAKIKDLSIRLPRLGCWVALLPSFCAVDPPLPWLAGHLFSRSLGVVEFAKDLQRFAGDATSGWKGVPERAQRLHWEASVGCDASLQIQLPHTKKLDRDGGATAPLPSSRSGRIGPQDWPPGHENHSSCRSLLGRGKRQPKSDLLNSEGNFFPVPFSCRFFGPRCQLGPPHQGRISPVIHLGSPRADAGV